MEWNRKNRWRCHIGKKRLSYFDKLFLFILVSFFLSFLFLIYIDKRLFSILKNYVDIEVSNLTTRIVNQVISYNRFDNTYLKRHSDGSYSYDTKVINDYVDLVTEKIDYELSNVEAGKIDSLFFRKNNKYKNIKNGLIFDVMFSSIKGSTLFSSIGPGIPVRLSFIGEVTSSIDIKTKEYGINNILVKVILNINIKERTSMPFTSNEQIIKISEPLTVDIIKGDIPEYYKTS